MRLGDVETWGRINRQVNLSGLVHPVLHESPWRGCAVVQVEVEYVLRNDRAAGADGWETGHLCLIGRGFEYIPRPGWERQAGYVWLAKLVDAVRPGAPELGIDLRAATAALQHDGREQ